MACNCVECQRRSKHRGRLLCRLLRCRRTRRHPSALFIVQESRARILRNAADALQARARIRARRGMPILQRRMGTGASVSAILYQAQHMAANEWRGTGMRVSRASWVLTPST